MSRDTKIGLRFALGFFVLALLMGCASGPSRDRHQQPPRPVHGWTTNGGTWQDLGGGIVVVQPPPVNTYSNPQGRGPSTTIMVQ